MTTTRHVDLVDDLRKLASEPPWLEFKVNNCDPSRVGRTISAISNAARLYDKSHGYMIWGVDDTSHDLVGTNFNPSTMRIGNQNIELWLSNKLSPSINFSFTEVAHPSGQRLVTLVHRLRRKVQAAW
jgi:predicted HTH transcriptional regulator